MGQSSPVLFLQVSKEDRGNIIDSAVLEQREMGVFPSLFWAVLTSFILMSFAVYFLGEWVRC